MTELTTAADMMDEDLPLAVSRLSDLGLRYLDLKDQVFGRPIANLDDERRDRLASLLAGTGLSVYCFSSVLGYWHLDQLDEATFRRRLEEGARNLIATSNVVRPAKVRLIACEFDEGAAGDGATAYLETRAPWVYGAYRDAVEQLTDAGLAVTFENEPRTIFANPEETIAFFERLDRPRAGFTWDVHNMWQSGTYPSLEVYRTLQPLIDFVHLKGGRADSTDPTTLVYRSPLESASWPVREIVSAIIADGVSPVLCVNPFRGSMATGPGLPPVAGSPEMIRDYATRDVAFLRETFLEVA